jgi:CubicO group peptidase (beta-lactamase class C family)
MPDFDSIAAAWREQTGTPSLSIGVFRQGALLHAAGYGSASRETIYQAASVGKQFTAALAVLLAESGEGPALDEPATKWLPEIPPSWAGITLRHLLSHTAGVPSAGYNSLELAPDYTDSEIARAIASGPLEFAPGTGWRYSNGGYVLAGFVIGRATGTFYGDLLRDRIFLPLGMETATVNGPGAPIGFDRKKDGGIAPAAYVSPSLNRLADGGLNLSVLDFARWEAALSGAWFARLAAMFEGSFGYGLGWFLSSTERGRIADHDGGWQGFSTGMARYLDEGISAVALANLAEQDALGLAHALCAP